MSEPKDKRELEYEIAFNCRNKELELFWKRSNFYWLFNGAALVAYTSLPQDNYNLLLMISSFGVLSSTVWMLGNMGSRWWQQHWETKLDITSRAYNTNIFSPEWWQSSSKYQTSEIQNNLPKKQYEIFFTHRFSVSRITIVFSIYFFVIWLLVFGYTIYLSYKSSEFLLPTLVITIYFLVWMFCLKGEDRESSS